MEKKSIIIIGGGIAGLAVGCYCQMNGYNTQIFEMHDKAGGLCTAWDRKGYTIDGCLAWLWGSSPNNSFYSFWEELGIIQGKQIINMEELLRIETRDGKVFHLYTDADRLEHQMKEIAPEDSAFIEEFTHDIRHFGSFKMPMEKNPELYSPLDYLKYAFKMVPYLGSFRKWSKMSLGEMMECFKNPSLRYIWQQIWMPQFSVFGLINTLAPMNQKEAGYVLGGSIPLIDSIETRYLKLGGKISFKKKVAKILVEDNHAIGIKLDDGTEERADIVISAADGHFTIFEMLDGKFINSKIQGYYEKMLVFPPLLYVGLGVNRSFDDMDKIISGLLVELEKPLVIGNEEQKFLNVRIHNFDPTLAPSGKTLITCFIATSYKYWESLRKDISNYKEEKAKIADKIISLLDKRFPGLSKQVEMIDIATPITFQRYTGNWQGSYEGWVLTPDTSMTSVMSKTLPGLKNFYMVGQWVQPGGGLPSGILTGKWVTQMICKADKKKFVATKP